MEQLSVTDYAKLLGVTRQAILLQIKEKGCRKMLRLKKLVILILYLCVGKKNKKKSFEMLHNVGYKTSSGLNSNNLSN